MRRIKPAGKGFVSLDGGLINLNEYKSIRPEILGLFEDPTGNDVYAIAFTPLNPSHENIKNGVDGTWLITYKENEKRDFEADRKVVLEAMGEQEGSRMRWWINYVITPFSIALIILAIERGWLVGLYDFVYLHIEKMCK